MSEKRIQLALAPMAGVGDRAFRETCADFGVDRFTTEMISAKAVHFGDKKTVALADTGQKERPIAIQLFGSQPDLLAQAAEALGDAARCDGIDLNFGCPVPKIVSGGDGSALMRDPALCYEIVRAVVSATSLPVSVKMRAGWDADHLNAPEIAQLCEKAGAKSLAVHGRTRVDFYREGTMRPQVIRQVKEAVGIPVWASGDVVDARSAEKLLEETGCDGLMIGRGALGAPWIFARIRAALEGKEAQAVDYGAVMRRHIDLAFRYKPLLAGREMRMHMAQYLKGFPGAAAMRNRASHAETREEYWTLVDEMERNWHGI